MKQVSLSAVLVAFAVLIVGVPAHPQQPKKIFRIGYLSSGGPASESVRSEGIRWALHELGYIEGQNIAVEYRYAEGKPDRLPELAADMVRLKVDVIVVSGGTPGVQAAKSATKTIPIVMTGQGSDPVEAGFVEGLARPGGNVTGITNLTPELGASGWRYLKKPSAKLPASRFSTIRPVRQIHSR